MKRLFISPLIVALCCFSLSACQTSPVTGEPTDAETFLTTEKDETYEVNTKEEQMTGFSESDPIGPETVEVESDDEEWDTNNDTVEIGTETYVESGSEYATETESEADYVTENEDLSVGEDTRKPDTDITETSRAENTDTESVAESATSNSSVESTVESEEEIETAYDEDQGEWDKG